MKKMICFGVVISLLVLGGCSSENKKVEDVKIGVSLGVGEAIRWANEERFMKEEAATLGVQIETRLNKTDQPKTQLEDCKEMIDSGIDVLILTPRDANKASEILAYAKKHKVKVISYARIVLNESVDLFVGYDSLKIGQMMGQYLSEMVYQGDYIILRGDENDNNANLLYEGSMRSIQALGDSIKIMLDAPVPGWSVDEAKNLVRQAIIDNNYKVDAILAPNDKIADGCIQVLEELNVTTPVVITGMDGEVSAAKHIVEGRQSMTVHMDLKELAQTAVKEAYHMAMGEKVNVNTEFDNKSEAPVPANLVNGKIVTSKNLDAILIDSGYLRKEDVYGE